MIQNKVILSDLEETEIKELWEKKIKGVCFICKREIPKTWDYYKVRGNCCASCSSRLNKVTKR